MRCMGEIWWTAARMSQAPKSPNTPKRVWGRDTSGTLILFFLTIKQSGVCRTGYPFIIEMHSSFVAVSQSCADCPHSPWGHAPWHLPLQLQLTAQRDDVLAIGVDYTRHRQGGRCANIRAGMGAGAGAGAGTRCVAGTRRKNKQHNRYRYSG